MATDTLYNRDLDVIDQLWNVQIRGWKEIVPPEILDPPGSANWLVEQFGLAIDGGIIWTDYDGPADDPWLFAALVSDDTLPRLMAFAEEAGYVIVSKSQIDDAQVYGDNQGTITILKHPEGWVIAE